MIRIVPGPLVAVAVSLALAACSAAPEDDAATSAPSALGTDAYETYADFARAEGADPRPGTVTVIGLRGLSTDGEQHATTYAHAFDDTLVVLRADGKVDRFPAATHPHQSHGGGVPDVDHDGVPDVGIIRPGLYDVLPRDRTIASMPSYAVMRGGTDRLPGWRDTDHDGRIDDAERSASEERGDVLTAVLFHQGEGDAPPAVGCQVLPAASMRAFVASVGGARAKFRYVLVDMTDRDATGLPR
jgi:hypothetical protein